MVHSSVGYCPCGAEIWVEYLPAAGGAQAPWRVRYFDEAHQPIDTCPMCSRPIDEEELDSR